MTKIKNTPLHAVLWRKRENGLLKCLSVDKADPKPSHIWYASPRLINRGVLSQSYNYNLV